MNDFKIGIKDRHPLIDFAYYGSKARRHAHPDVLIGEHSPYPLFREGDILDANAIFNLIKCTNCRDLIAYEEIQKHILDDVIHVTQDDRARWDAGSSRADWNEEDDSSPSYIKNKPDITNYVNGVTYDSNTKRINFKHDGVIVSYVDATPFVIDGMIDSVEIDDGNLVIIWNTDAGKQTVYIPLTDIFDPSLYYIKTEVNNLLSPKANLADLATIAISGSYNDLNDKPHIPNDQVQADWEQTNTSEPDYIKNKPNLAAVAISGDYTDLINKPINVSEFYNDVHYVSSDNLGELAYKNTASANYTPSGNISTATANFVGGSTANLTTLLLSTTTISVHDTPSLLTENIKQVKTWNEGLMFDASYDENNETLTFTAGILPSLTTEQKQVGVNIIQGLLQTFEAVNSPFTAVTGLSNGNSAVVTELHSGININPQTFTGNQATITVS